MTKLKPHPLALIFPPRGDEEYNALRESIRANGLKDPITLLEKMVLDGLHRLRGCLETGIEPRFEEWDGLGSPLSFVIDKNLHRRHLDQSQRAMLATELKAALEKEAKANMKRGGQGLADLPNHNSRDRAAELTNVSPRLVGSAEVVRKRGTPELAAAVRRGEVTVSAAAEVSELGQEEQAKVVAGGKKAVCTKAADLRRAKKAKASTNQRRLSRPPNFPTPHSILGRGSVIFPYFDAL